MYESSAERWSPVQSIEKILLSVLSMLAEPNVESGANIDACVRIIFSTSEKKKNKRAYSHVHQKMYRDDRDAYEKTIRRQVQEQLGL